MRTEPQGTPKPGGWGEREAQKTGGNSKGCRDVEAKGRNGFQKKGRTNSLQGAGQIREGLGKVAVIGGNCCVAAGSTLNSWVTLIR